MSGKSNEEFREEVFSLVGDEYTFLDPYINNKTKLRVRHNCDKCNNYTWEVNPKAFLRLGSRCPECNRLNKNKGHEKFIEEINELYHGEYEVLGNYVNASTKILMKHNCGNEWEVQPCHILKRSCCPKCSKSAAKTQEQFKKEIFDKYGDEYEVLGNYVNNVTKILMRHNTCGNEYSVRPSDILSGYRCPKCFGTPKKTTEEIRQKLFEEVGDEYTLIGEYENAKTPIQLKHNVCGMVIKPTFKDFMRKDSKRVRCKCCSNLSVGEQIIEEILINNGIKFEEQYKIPECKNKRPLPFDFAILNEDGSLNCLIEYQGRQHYMNENFFYKCDEDFVDRVLTDCSKQAYCEYKNIKLIQIPYTKINNLEQVLKEENVI